MIQLMQREVVGRGWMDKEEFVELLALAQSAPGPIAINTSVFLGYKVRGMKGVVATTLGTIIPPFVIILLVAMFFADVREYPAVERVFRGMRPAVVALIVGPIFSLARGMDGWRIVLAICALAVVWMMGVSPIYMILAGAVGGYIYGLYRKK